ncbi:OLC1v1027209C1 [Oldenlandia corymbosa var. corymbosa]|uniref:OLC1v1027209C1 n=1 Tax=Oldenlandia corymbosa var. corymbosa TaxID=529605 RepID=A0AAV1C9H6_OLDCO|nr:OLC1v1027209C1 [Oldenlandia corymbosa var. corymbosa]
MSAQGRPSGTDGSDFSYRMVVDSRYTKVTKYKRQLAILFVIQTILQSLVVLLSLPLKISGRVEDADIISSFLCLMSIFQYLLGFEGRRRSREKFLWIFLVLSSMAAPFAILAFSKNSYVLQVMKDFGSWKSSPVDLIKPAALLSGNVVRAFMISTGKSLIHNMSPPKKKVA